MFYRMIARKRDQWLASPACPAADIIAYIQARGRLRDAQAEAVKTYLFLKIACENRPLAELFCRGTFNTLDLEEVALTAKTKGFLRSHPAAAALFEYACLKNDAGEQASGALEEQLREAPEKVDCGKFFREAFYNVSYTEYLFSLPMGAGKTYLMAAFLYLDLYFGQNEPDNPAFAHNFIILAPSGLKSSVVPSLRTIQNFDPTWVIPEPAASELKRLISFEVLDQNKTASKSNKTKNPNVQKIANHQPLSDSFGLVLVANAEKVILDRIPLEDGQMTIFQASDDERDRQANELRSLIGKIPYLSVFIDEVHHAVSNEIKLRAVVNRWAESRTMNSVIGFSGTPYLEKAEKIEVTDKLSIASAEISNIVYYYPLVDGVGNFLKRPVVKIVEQADSGRIIESGVREFLDSYKDTVYEGGLTAKLGVYCGTIEKLEETVYPLVSRVSAEYGISSGAILKFHRGNRQYPQPVDSQMRFETLDQPLSTVRIILLVQIGKEGWDCRSLTGIILSQEGDCPKNMVLQTSCRCLRQVVRGAPETALIYLNGANGEKLNAQLQKQHHISVREFMEGGGTPFTLNRYDRTAYLKLPKLDFYQLKIGYEAEETEPANPEAGIPRAAEGARITGSITKTGDFTTLFHTTAFDDAERGTEPATFSGWLCAIARGSFGTLSMDALRGHEALLRPVFETITYQKGDACYFSSRYDRRQVEANVRKAFCDKRTCLTREELIPQGASLLNIANFTPAIQTDKTEDYYPEREMVERIIADDAGKLKPDKATRQMMELAEQTGQTRILEELRAQVTSHPQKDRSFHYLPYRTDSKFEQTFLDGALSLPELRGLGLEVYYNGDRMLTEFQIKCYKTSGGRRRYIGRYTPDFLILRRRDGEIYKVLIVETKGEGYANAHAFKDRRAFMETDFLRRNNAAFGYERFEYLYLEDSQPESERLRLTHDKICEFFGEGKNHAD